VTALHFTKGHGTGNDFVLGSDPDGELGLPEARLAEIAGTAAAAAGQRAGAAGATPSG
jgi:diaminopimelate epimerase